MQVKSLSLSLTRAEMPFRWDLYEAKHKGLTTVANFTFTQNKFRPAYSSGKTHELADCVIDNGVDFGDACWRGTEIGRGWFYHHGFAFDQHDNVSYGDYGAGHELPVLRHEHGQC